SVTLITAAGLGDGTGYTQLGRAATAALLNSCALVAFSNYAAYPYTTSQIISETRAIFQMSITATSRAAALALATKYDKANNSTCVLDNAAVKTASVPTVDASESDAVTQLAVSSFPNPYTDRVRFVISNPKAGQGSLQVYNLLGQKIKTVFQGYLPAGKQTFDFVVPPTRRSNLIYMLTVGKEKVTGQIVQAIK
ncbi:MAG TPA: T9SS type A sorting domain-containing protein, partial [Flavitalea sp.]|nr:T9SS type A sorting domain-containing protein [Flavitalea sp.]